MPIQLQTGAGQRVFNFNETRLEKILNARTAGEAERMGWLDRLTDRFQGGVKRQAIRDLYISISAPAPHESRPAAVLMRFYRLRDLVVPDDREQFAVELAPPNDQGDWGYALSVGDTRIHSSPPGMRDSTETSFVEFQSAAQTAHLLHQTMALADRCRAAEHPIQGKGGYVDLEALSELRTEFNQSVNMPGLGLEGVDAFERLLELQKTLTAPIVGQAFSAMRDTKVGSTNLLVIVYGDRAPSAVSPWLASLAHQIVSGDPLDIITAAKYLGDQMVERLTSRSTVKEAEGLAETEFGAIARQMSNTSLSALYKVYLDQPHLVQASGVMGNISMVIENNLAPVDDAENALFWQQAKPRAQPFVWGLSAVEVMFEVIGKEMTGRGLTVKIDPELKAITDAARYPESAEQLIVNCIGTGTPVDNAVANLRSAAPPPGALRA